VIDFGLSKLSEKVEDQAVDLFLLYEAIKSTHFEHLERAWETIIKVYGQRYSNSPEIMKRIEQIKRRRRYK
jgi:Kae1-associated kinase Bud32